MLRKSTSNVYGLTQMKCVPCRGGEPTLTDAEMADVLPTVRDWSVVERGDGIKRLERIFKFKNFAEALSFTDGVGQIAEEEGHHPAILTEYIIQPSTWFGLEFAIVALGAPGGI